MRSNSQGKELVDALRRTCPGLRVVHEGRAAILDNPVVAVLLSLVKFAAHPGDTFAGWSVVEIKPNSVWISRNGNNVYLSSQ